MDEVARTMRVSRRWLQGFIRDHPFYRLCGTKKVFTDEDVARLIGALPCPGSSSRRAKARRSSGTSGASTAESLLTEVRALSRGGRQPRSSQPGNARQNVVSLPSRPRNQPPD